MRGIAALAVLIAHCGHTFRSGLIDESDFRLGFDNVLLAIMQVLVQANTAVLFFFVLSGFVLGESLRRSRTGPVEALVRFVVRRAFRLYPALILAVLFAAVVLTLISGAHIPGLLPSIERAMQVSIAPHSLVANLLGLGYEIDPPLWSVQVELVMIAILPIMVFVSRWTTLWIDFAIFGLMAYFTLRWPAHIPAPLRWAFYFQLGLILPRMIANSITRRVLSSPTVTMVFLLALIPIDWMFLFGIFPPQFKLVANAFFSAQIIGFVILQPKAAGSRILETRPLVFLGDISYSLYIYAMPVQFLVTATVIARLMPNSPSALQDTLMTLLLMAMTVAVTVPLAAASYYLIERPGIFASRWILSSLGRPSQLNNPSRPRTTGFLNLSQTRVRPARSV
jgi:peptidoglycan/LPS O-acetylase OafA/YrhL